MGPVDFAEGTWLGVELRTPKGKNDGSVQGKRYFSCKAMHGLIVRPSKVTVRGINGAKLVTEGGGGGGMTGSPGDDEVGEADGNGVHRVPPQQLVLRRSGMG